MKSASEKIKLILNLLETNRDTLRAGLENKIKQVFEADGFVLSVNNTQAGEDESED